MASGLYNTTPSPSGSTGLLHSASSSVSQASQHNWFDMTGVVVGLNYFIIAFCLFNTVILCIDFYVRYFLMSKNGEMLKNIQAGSKSFKKSMNSWLTYVPLLIVFICYIIWKEVNPWGWLLGVLFIVAAVIKIIWEYLKTPITKVVQGEDSSIIGRGFKTVNIFQKKSSSSSSTSGSKVSMNGGIIGEVLTQVGGLGTEALKQTTGVSVSSDGDKKDGGDKKK